MLDLSMTSRRTSWEKTFQGPLMSAIMDQDLTKVQSTIARARDLTISIMGIKPMLPFKEWYMVAHQKEYLAMRMLQQSLMEERIFIQHHKRSSPISKVSLGEKQAVLKGCLLLWKSLDLSKTILIIKVRKIFIVYKSSVETMIISSMCYCIPDFGHFTLSNM
jgi:hypothetical protein